jgi:DNA-binding NtrC family response regulator
VARAIHAAGANAQRRFLLIDCEEMAARGAESRIFGDGSNPRGLLERSFGGSVLFDEVAALSPTGQAMLARVIDRRTPYRILASTVYDLEARVREGLFRRDLYIRLNVFPVTVPPLRERRSDIPMLAAHFLKRVAGSRDCSSRDLRFKLTDEVLRLLTHYDWPENVRELENCMVRAANMTDAEFIAKSQLTTALQNLVGNGKDDLAERVYGEIIPLAEVEKRTILNALRACAGDRIEAARRLRIGKTTLYRKLKEYEAMGVDLHSTGASA